MAGCIKKSDPTHPIFWTTFGCRRNYDFKIDIKILSCQKNTEDKKTVFFGFFIRCYTILWHYLGYAMQSSGHNISNFYINL